MAGLGNFTGRVNRWRLCLLFAGMVFSCSGFFSAPPAAGKNVNPNPKGKDKKEQPLDSAADRAPEAQKKTGGWSPELALLGTLALPIGDAGSILDMGFGGKADLTLNIPALRFLKQKSFDLRPG